MKYVYIAGPMTKGLMTHNIGQAINAAHELMRCGLYPFCPQLNIFWEALLPLDDRPSYESWLSWDLGWLKKCDALLRLPGESHGADREEARARELGIPIFYSLAELTDAAESIAEFGNG